MAKAIRDTMLLALVLAFVAVTFVLFVPGQAPQDNAAHIDVPRQLIPNHHAITKHGQDAVEITGKYNACGGDGWLKLFSPELESILCLDKDPYQADDDERVGAIFLGIDVGACIALGVSAVYFLTSFYMSAKRARRVISRDGYRR